MRLLVALLVSFVFISGSVAQDKQLFKSYFLSAEEFFFLEDFDEAIFYYSELLKLDPGN
jgi:tetratricopeptide (TPR) repeat protein